MAQLHTTTDSISPPAQTPTRGTRAAETEPTAGPDRVVATVAAGVELLGPYQGSGFRQPRFLIRRGDGQVAQLPRLLYRTVCLLDGHRDLAAVAARLNDEFSTETAREITSQQVAFWLDQRLGPAGITDPLPAHHDTSDPAGIRDGGARDGGGGATGAPGAGPTRSDHLLMLRLRKALVPERVVWRIAGVFAPLFYPLVVLVLVSGFVAVDVALLATAGWSGLVASGQAVVATPTLTLALLGIIAAAGVLHESGHVGACRYSGAVPGAMGVGIYIVWPAFYSTVTDAYRLSRRGRLRTDLGGVYLNAVVLTALGAAYLATGAPWLLAAVALLHLETAWQFLPSLRLDGYYILADLVGVPDLFARMGPILTGLARPRRPAPVAVRELKSWVRRTITAWVLLVVPFLAYWIVLFLALAPHLAPAAWRALHELIETAVGAGAELRLAATVLAGVQIVLLVLPWIGGAVLTATLIRRLARRPLRAARAAIATGRRSPHPRTPDKRATRPGHRHRHCPRARRTLDRPPVTRAGVVGDDPCPLNSEPRAGGA